MKFYLTRPSPIAGTWYPAKPGVLKRAMNAYLKEVEPRDDIKDIVSVVVPHAGYIYSGQVAAHAFAALKGKHFDYVVVCSPLHAFHPAKVLTTDHQAFQIPFDAIPVAKELVNQIDMKFQAITKERILPIAFDQEHSLEIQLPFICSVLKEGFELIPLMVRTDDVDVIAGLVTSVVEIMKDKSVLFVASTDLSHFYPRREAQVYDTHMVQQIVDLNAEGVLEAEKSGKGFACGASAVATVIEISKAFGAKKVELLNYSTSGEVTGDYTNVVGYAALAIMR